MKHMFIMRGLPGSGKSTKAKEISQKYDAVICSADDFFMEDGVYAFNRNLLHRAHEQCEYKALSAVLDGKNVVIDNTNTRFSEFTKYRKMAEKNGYTVSIVYSDCSWRWDVDECTKRNTHGVPKETIQIMKDRFEV